MTDPTGWSFLSYRRSRKREAALLIQAQNDLGIPTWQDTEDLNEEHTESALTQVLEDPRTANALVWLTPEVRESSMMQRVEFPKIQKRAEAGDGFFFVPVMAGGLQYDAIDNVVENRYNVHDWSEWNLRKVNGDPISPDEALRVSKWVLRRRLTTLHESLAPGDPLVLSFYTRSPPPSVSSSSLVLNWTHRFRGRKPLPEAWETFLLPALEALVDAIGKFAPGRSLIASGRAATSAALALGYHFSAPRGIRVEWRQDTLFRDAGAWSLDTPREDSGFSFRSQGMDVDASDLAVLVSVAHDVEPAVANSKNHLPRFRAALHCAGEPGKLLRPAEATDIAFLVGEAIRQARRDYVGLERVHLFMSVPVGLAMMIGQQLNACGPIQSYEHLSVNTVGRYTASVLLR